jgi:hypothetical protein
MFSKRLGFELDAYLGLRQDGDVRVVGWKRGGIYDMMTIDNDEYNVYAHGCFEGQ